MHSSHVPNGALVCLGAHARKAPRVDLPGESRAVVFLSQSEGTARASVLTGTGPDGASAWQAVADQLPAAEAPPRWLRLDWVHTVEETTWQGLRTALRGVKRNYFRYGIALDPAFRHAFLEGELNANAMLYGGSEEPAALLNERNFRSYARKRHGLTDLTFAPDEPVWVFATRGLFVGEDGVPRELAGDLLNSGRRAIETMSPELVGDLVAAGSRYLATQVQPQGRFHYGWHPCFDRPIEAYNSLRHASTLYAMFEAWEVTRDPQLWEACERSLGCLTQDLIRTVAGAEGRHAAFLVDEPDEVKLGGNAVAVLALLKHAAISGSGASRQLAERLGEGILRMQDPLAGSFVHVLAFPSLAIKEPFRIIYYEGEAAFALVRLYEATGDARWLAAAEKACEHFIREDLSRHHDHWLGYFVAHLARHRPEERYIKFGIANFADHLDFVAGRVTTFPTLLELMMASHELLEIVDSDPHARPLLASLDLDKFYRSLDYRARYLLNGHFWPELAMYFANPERIVGSFFIRHHSFRVRIDDVEHYLSGLVAYLRFLLAGEPRVGAEPSAPPDRGHWDASRLVRATGGRWLVAPGDEWSASGLCTAPQTLRAGDIVAVRDPDGDVGVRPAQVARLGAEPAAWLVGAAGRPEASGAPVLQVENVRSATLALGRDARARMSGKVVGITGSAGKTSTVAMLADCLQAFGSVAGTRHNANLPTGIAWNLASIPWQTDHVVLELAIGRMKQNARLVRPDVAVFTNILPAHLEFHADLPTIAARKSAIFDAMAPGSVAVLNRDMAEWDQVNLAARVRGLEVVTYGRSASCDFRLLGYDRASKTVTARVAGRELDYQLGAAGEHMALNSLAALAAVAALGHDPQWAIERLARFAPLDGRGRERPLVLGGGRRVLVLDESYNANPGSMDAALRLLAGTRASGRRIAVLGEMLELGDSAQDHHTRLAASIEALPIDRVYVLGSLYAQAWKRLPPARRGLHARTRAELQEALVRDAADGDVLLFKGSRATGVHRIVGELARAGGEPGGAG